MKKTILLLTTLLATAICVKAQTKQPETKPVKAAYRKVVQIPVEDYQSLTGIAESYKGLIIYKHGIPADASKELQINIDAYLQALQGRIKLDSIKIDQK